MTFLASQRIILQSGCVTLLVLYRSMVPGHLFSLNPTCTDPSGAAATMPQKKPRISLAQE